MIRSEENINFQINCKVLDNVVIEMSDGKSNRYSGYENGVEIGSQIFIKFDFSNIVYNEKNFYEIDLESNIGIRDQTFRSRTKVDYFIRRYDDSFTYDDPYFWYLSNDQIQIVGIPGEIMLSRYYKNDWSLIYTKGSSTGSQIISANCMNVSNKYDSILNILSSEHDEN